jgi:hypothetical protein
MRVHSCRVAFVYYGSLSCFRFLPRWFAAHVCVFGVMGSIFDFASSHRVARSRGLGFQPKWLAPSCWVFQKCGSLRLDSFQMHRLTRGLQCFVYCGSLSTKGSSRDPVHLSPMVFLRGGSLLTRSVFSPSGSLPLYCSSPTLVHSGKLDFAPSGSLLLTALPDTGFAIPSRFSTTTAHSLDVDFGYHDSLVAL